MTRPKGEEDKADIGRGGKTTSGNGQAWSSPSPREQWRTGENGGNDVDADPLNGSSLSPPSD